MSAPIIVATITGVDKAGRVIHRQVTGEPNKPLTVRRGWLGVWCPDNWRDKKLTTRDNGRRIELARGAQLYVHVKVDPVSHLSRRQRRRIKRKLR